MSGDDITRRLIVKDGDTPPGAMHALTPRTNVRIPLGVIASFIVTFHLATLTSLFYWLWLLHQRTDELPLLRVRMETMTESVGRLLDRFGIDRASATQPTTHGP
jgi:hypothetical protein